MIGANCKLCNAMLLQQKKKTYCNLKPTKFHYRYLNSTKFHRSEHHHFPKVPLICSSLSISTPQQGISITCLLSTLPNLDIDSTWFNMIQHDSTWFNKLLHCWWTTPGTTHYCQWKLISYIEFFFARCLWIFRWPPSPNTTLNKQKKYKTQEKIQMFFCSLPPSR